MSNLVTPGRDWGGRSLSQGMAGRRGTTVKVLSPSGLTKLRFLWMKNMASSTPRVEHLHDCRSDGGATWVPVKIDLAKRRFEGDFLASLRKVAPDANHAVIVLSQGELFDWLMPTSYSSCVKTGVRSGLPRKFPARVSENPSPTGDILVRRYGSGLRKRNPAAVTAVPLCHAIA